jgi:hypothetical protein
MIILNNKQLQINDEAPAAAVPVEVVVEVVVVLVVVLFVVDVIGVVLSLCCSFRGKADASTTNDDTNWWSG